MKLLIAILLLGTLASCWPTSVSFRDTGSMAPEWKNFMLETLENSAPNAPLSYPAVLSEAIKDGVQNNTRLKLTSNPDSAQITIQGTVTSYSVSPVALQNGDVAAKNRLTISTNYTIYISEPEEQTMTLTSTRFADYDSSQDLAAVETQLLDEINKQIVQDVINKLLSNW